MSETTASPLPATETELAATAATPEVPAATETPPETAVKTTSKVVTKDSFDKLASDYAKLKKDYNAKLSGDELEAARITEIQTELETLRTEHQVAQLEISLTKGGVENSAEIAELFVTGETDKAITALTKAKDAQIAELQKKLTVAEQRAALAPPVGEPPDALAGKSLTELMQMANTNPGSMPQIMAYIEKMNKPIKKE